MDNAAKIGPAPEDIRPPGLGADLRVVFRCPDCDVQGWVHWSQLPQGMKCRRCGGEFWIGTDGNLHSARSAEKVRFDCPRCGSKQQLPVELAVRRATCPTCGLKCKRTAAGGFQAPTKQKTARIAGGVALGRLKLAWPFVARPRLALTLVLIAIIAVITTAVWRLKSPPSDTLERRAIDFTNLCFQGKMDLAAEFLVAEQAKKLLAWATLIGAKGPTSSTRSSRVRIRAVANFRQPSQADVRIEVERGARAKSAHTQHWRRSEDGTWRFDVESTLRSIVRPDH